MTDREKLIEILKVPIYPHELADPAEVVADYLLDNGVTFQRWIPVTERLPEIGDICFVVVKYKYDFEKEYTYDTDAAIYCSADGYIDDCWDTFNDWNEGQQHIHVTHWMPLPEAPEEESENG